MRVLVFLILLLLPIPALAQDAAEPVLRMEFKETEAIPGQPLVLRVTLLVPTWLPKPPVFPSFEIPNVMVRLPSRASGPTSERIKGETWSGITRAYRLYPMTAGRFEIPPQPIVVTYADPETRKPVVKTLNTDVVSFEGRLPDGAESLDPFIAAEDLELKQVIEGTPEDLAPGDAVTLRITARVKGVSPFFLPPFEAGERQPGLSVYASEPVVTETENRGVLAGTREETVTYVAEHGGRYNADPISLNWYNLKSGSVEEITLDGIEFTVRGDPPPPVEQQAIDWRATAVNVLAGLAILAILYGVGRLAIPRLARACRQRKERWLQSERHAFNQAIKALRRKDLDGSLKAISLWRGRIQSHHVDFEELSRSMAALGKTSYGGGSVSHSGESWSAARDALTKTRKDYMTAKRQDRHSHRLPPLNPA